MELIFKMRLVVILSTIQLFCQVRGQNGFSDFATNDLLRYARAQQASDRTPPQAINEAIRSVNLPFESRPLVPYQNEPASLERSRPQALRRIGNQRGATNRNGPRYDPDGNRLRRPTNFQIPTRNSEQQSNAKQTLRRQNPEEQRSRPSERQEVSGFRRETPFAEDRPTLQTRPTYGNPTPDYEYVPEKTVNNPEVLQEIEDAPEAVSERRNGPAKSYQPVSGPLRGVNGADYVKSPYGYEIPEEQKGLQASVREGADTFGKQDLGVYQNEERLSFQIHGHDGPNSYRYGYDTGNGYNRQFRYEERDGKGYLKGRYGFFDKYGKLQVTNYEADPYKGFHAEGPGTA